jgi:hypothetical protein
MMDIFFQDPGEVPLPPDEVRIRDLIPTPWPDGRRVKVYLEVDPFQKRPSAQVEILNTAGDVVAEVSVIETMTRKMEFNMHLRHPELAGSYRIAVVLYYQSLPPASESTESPGENLPERIIVDAREAGFVIPANL